MFRYRTVWDRSGQAQGLIVWSYVQFAVNTTTIVSIIRVDVRSRHGLSKYILIRFKLEELKFCKFVRRTIEEFFTTGESFKKIRAILIIRVSQESIIRSRRN